MTRIVTPLACVVLLAACSSLPDWVVAPAFLSQSTDADLGHYSFNWHLSGERQVAPFQIFDDGKKTWLQFMPAQVIPAVFQRTDKGERLLSYTRQGDYLIIDGVWPELTFRGGLLHAAAQKRSGNNAIVATGADPATLPVPVSPAVETRVTAEHDGGVSDVNDQLLSTEPSAIGDRVFTDDASARSHNTVAADTTAIERLPLADDNDVSGLISASFESLGHVPVLSTSYGMAGREPKPEASYGITLHDQNFRKALHRWAQQANWTFAPEHWAVDVDIPISAEAVFSGSFQSAVQDLLSATELAERPLRPCFYSNRVLRVVSYSQLCDRSGARES